MNAAQRARLAALELAIARNRRAVEVEVKPTCMMSDAEAVLAWHTMCRTWTPSMRSADLSDDDREVIRVWRELTAA